MKKAIILTSLLLCFYAVDSYSQVRVGGGFVWSTIGDNDFGINFNGEYLITDKISGEVGVSIFFVEDIGPIDLGFWAINLDGHYYFHGDGSGPYATAGLQIATVTGGFDGFSNSNTSVGLNLGGGYAWDLGNRLTPFADAKYSSEGDQFVIRAGVRYALN